MNQQEVESLATLCERKEESENGMEVCYYCWFYRRASREAFGEEYLHPMRSLVILLHTRVRYYLLHAREILYPQSRFCVYHVRNKHVIYNS